METLLFELNLISRNAEVETHETVAENIGISTEFLMQISKGDLNHTSENREIVKDIISEYRGIAHYEFAGN